MVFIVFNSEINIGFNVTQNVFVQTTSAFIYITFSHLADAFIQSDLQLGST